MERRLAAILIADVAGYLRLSTSRFPMVDRLSSPARLDFHAGVIRRGVVTKNSNDSMREGVMSEAGGRAEVDFRRLEVCF